MTDTEIAGTSMLLTSRQVADILSVSTQTVSRWRIEGTGPHWVNLNGMPRYLGADVDAFIEGGRQ